VTSGGTARIVRPTVRRNVKAQRRPAGSGKAESDGKADLWAHGYGRAALERMMRLPGAS